MAERKNIKNVVVPMLATRWDDSGNNSLSLNRFTNLFFESITPTEHPFTIYLSLYKSWPTFELESASQAVNAAWSVSQVNEGGNDFIIYRRDLRLSLVSLVLCLFVCGFLVTYTVKNFLIVSMSYLGLAIGASKWVDLVSGQGSTNQLMSQIAVLIVIAVAFPLIVMWNPKDIFGNAGGRPNA
jgi:hypothetical protein